MAVEILILSGSRQGERLVFEGEQFRAGDEPACEVFFNPARDPAAQGRMLLFRRSDEGWSVLPMGHPGLMLDHEPLAEATTIRSGQVVRLSADGPDFRFRVVAASEARTPAFAPPGPAVLPAGVPAAASPDVSAARHPRGWSTTPVLATDSAPPPAPAVDLDAMVRATAAAPSLVPPTPTAEKDEGTTRLVVISALAGIGLAALVILAGWAIMNAARRAPTPAPPVNGPVSAESGEPVPPPPPERPPSKPKEQPKSEPAPVASPEATPRPDADTWEAALEPVRKAVYLLQVEQTLPNGSAMAWPFAGCCAISPNTLLTTGNVGCELLRFRYKRFRIYATRPDDAFRQEIGEIRVRTDYFEHESDRPRQRYCDLALLSVEGPLPSVAEVATDDDLAGLEGLPVGLISYPHEGNNVTSHDMFPLKVTEGRTFLVRALMPDTAGSPLCLDLTADVPPNAYGSPVFLKSGKLVGVYNEPPEQAEAVGIKNLHFVTVVHPQLIERGLRDRDETLWVEPRVQAGPDSGKKP